MGSSCAEGSAGNKVLFVVWCFLGMLGYRTEMSERRMNPGNGTLMAELVLLFVGFPVLFRLLPVRLSPLPALWLAALYCTYVLRRASGPNTMGLWNAGPLADCIGSVLGVFAVAAIIITVAVWRLRPQILFGFARNSPQFWALVMVLYPVLSVYPQGIIYRGFFFERYQSLFRSPADMIPASAAAFAFSHLIFRSSWPVALTFAGGLLFAWRYHVTGSLLVSSIEHALYGCFIFTVGLGGLFYHGAGRTALARIIHDFPGRLEKGKEFLTEVTETTHGDHGEVPAMFSVHSVVRWFEDTDTLNTL